MHLPALTEALDVLDESGIRRKVLAGGQSLVPAMNFRLARRRRLVDLNKIARPAYIRPDADGGLAIGAMTRDSVVEHDADGCRAFPVDR